ncbi:MAG: hypothetical protein WAN47_00860 [Nitrosotalea sp.]
MIEPKNLSRLIIATGTLIALLDVNMQCIAHAGYTIQADEVGYATT